MRVVLFGLWALCCTPIACSGAKVAPEGPRSSTSGHALPLTGAACAAKPIEPTRYLRQLSLDLRGRPPTIDELEEVVRDGKVNDARVETLLHSGDFLEQVATWHEPRLWPNVDRFKIAVRPLAAGERTSGRAFKRFSPDPELLGASAAKHPHAVLSAKFGFEGELHGSNVGCDDSVEYPPPALEGAQPTYVVAGRDRRRHAFPYYDPHGISLPYHDASHCPNMCSSKSATELAVPGATFPPGAFVDMTAPGSDANPDDLDPPGMHCPASHPYRIVNPCDNALHHSEPRFLRLEGYRPVVHYWSHERAIKTCAREAQVREVGLAGQNCATADTDVSCGCGPEGAFCMPAPSTDGEHAASRAEHDLQRAIDDEPLQIIKSVVARDEDYFEAFTTPRSFATGPLAWFFRAQTSAAIPFEIGAPAAPDALPDVPYDDDHWHEYARGDEHAGVLTTTAYLVRFPTWRARVSQFRTEMMCRPFTPSVASFPGPGDACTREPNLAKRCGCRNCHAAIEPMASWFGRWTERSAKYLDPRSFPAFDPMCEEHPEREPARCKNYVGGGLDADAARYQGTLLGYLYRSRDEEKRIDEGPRGLVDAAIASGELESCTVTTAWKTLLGRPMTEDETTTRLPEIERDFEAHHRSYRDLVRRIATSPEAQRIDAGGRAPRRLGADQLRASLVEATGFTWIAPHAVSDPDSPTGRRELPDADMIEVLAGTLGRANYDTTTSDAIDPAITFAKLASDAARSACRASVKSDLGVPDATKRRLLRFVAPDDTLASNGEGVRRNASYLALRFWGRQIGPDDAEMTPLLTLFARASEGATPSDGWRAVCIALATDPEFLTY